jgi:hypothetical protein
VRRAADEPARKATYSRPDEIRTATIILETGRRRTRAPRLAPSSNWADKAEALASYAKQANDNTLRQLADRIQARAIRREGELLQLIEVATNKHDVFTRAGAGPSKGRFAAGRDAGLSAFTDRTDPRQGDGIGPRIFGYAIYL